MASEPMLYATPTPAVTGDGGVPLPQLIADGRVPLALALAVGTRLAAELAQRHRRGELHLRLRPEAVRVDPDRGRVWLVDAASGETDASAAATAARLVYQSPEQSGRTGHAVDARSDLYALGVLLYELLVGVPPVRSDDPLEVVHWHLAGTAPAPASRVPDLPPVLSALVMKLLAKTPDERYQSAAGVGHDLAACARAWRERRCIEPFVLARHDTPARPPSAQRLYGREREAAWLRRAWQRLHDAAPGGAPTRPRLLLVEGPAGVGKTALVQQRVRPLVLGRGAFVGGKFDQLAQAQPFDAWLQAFDALVRQWLSASEPQLVQRRAAVLQALGDAGGVLAELVPAIGLVIGPQPEPPLLGPTETLNRFQRVLHDFVAAVATPAQPLVLFLDDLQWADAASLSLLEPLLTSREIGGLLLVGACRAHAPGAAQPLVHALDGLQARGVEIHRLVLGPLQPAALQQLLADRLACSLAEAAPLAQLLHARTGGNPLFVDQFLQLLEREGHLRHEPRRGRWSWRVESIAAAPLPDDVIELMTRSIERLAPRTQAVLTLAACIGSRFDLPTLACVSEQSAAAAAADLAPALAAGLLRPASPAPDDAPAVYDFLHDRVQQAAYARIADSRRREVHLRIGRLLAADVAAVDARLFDTVHHLNLGRELLHDEAERLRLAALDLEAGRRARASAAHEAARALHRAGLSLLEARHWTSDYALAFELHLEAAQSESSCGTYEAADRLFERLLASAGGDDDRARVLRQRSLHHERMARYADALACALDSLALLGLHVPADAAARQAALDREIAAIETRLGGRSIASLVDLPAMRSARLHTVMQTLTDSWASAFLVGDATLARLFSAIMVRLSLEHGNAAESAYGYVTHAITVGPLRGDHASAYAYGRLALAVNRRFDDRRLRAKVWQQFHAHVSLWCEPWADCLAYAREAWRAGLDSGDFLYGAYGAGTEVWTAMMATQDLAQFVRDYTPTVALLERLQHRAFAESVQLMLNTAKALMGRTDAPLSLGDATFDEQAYLRTYRGHAFFATIHGVCRLQLCVLLGTPAQALAAAREAGRTVHALPGTLWPPLHAYWQALALADAYAAGLGDAAPSRDQTLAEVARALAMHEALAVHCAHNFRAPALLLAAEQARLQGDAAQALVCYEQAIEFAAAHDLRPQQALACERAAQLRLQAGQRQLGALLLAQARRCWQAWGARAKLQALPWQPPQSEPPAAALPAPAADAAPTTGAPAPAASALDLYSVSKAAQAIAGEGQPERLLARLLHIARENAGAERACLVLESDHGPRVHGADALPADAAPADALPADVVPADVVPADVLRADVLRADATPRGDGVPLEQVLGLPQGIVNLVRRTGDSVVLADAWRDERWGDEPCIARRRLRSLMCVPVQQRGRRVGVLYLENGLTAGAFTGERIRVMQVLASEAASALENARLVAGLRQEIEERRQTQERLAAALDEVRRLQQDLEAENRYLRRDLIANVSHDLRTPLVALRGYLEMVATRGQDLPAAERDSYLGIALRQSERLSHLIDELFELAKLDFKGVQIECEAFGLADLAGDVLQKFRLAADARRVALALEAAAGLPRVQADLGLIERVFDNLIGNALQHTPAGGRVVIAIEDAGAALQVRVADSGCGIAAADLPHVFDRHYRGARTRAHGGGAGLGLAITQRILELHGSTIDVDSAPGRGSCFSFRLPVAG